MSSKLLYEISEMAADRRKRKKPVTSCSECHRRKQKCDRLQPCSNCTKREKKHLCAYTNVGEGEPLFDPRAASRTTGTPDLSQWAADRQATGPPAVRTPSERGKGHTRTVSACLGYSENNTTGTLGLIRMAGDAKPSPSDYTDDTNGNADVADRYRSLIRQLPSQKYVEALVAIFFSDLEWYYGVIDQPSFKEHLRAWNNISYATLRQGPFELQPDTRAFPALLFQVLAHALLFLPSKSAPTFNDIKYAHGMTFADLASEYSDAGNTIVSLLRKEDVTLAKVQAGLLRASFQKSTASVVQAWHTIGATIRDAQELGLHCADDTAALEDAAGSLGVLNEVDMRARLWLMLHLWDGHMGVVLGRPMSTRLTSNSWISLFSDIETRKEALADVNSHPAAPRVNLTPFSVFLCGYEVAYRYLQDIQELSAPSRTTANTDSHHQAIARVESIDASIVNGLRNLPEWAETNGNNNSYDPSFLHSRPWLPAAVETLFTEVHFVLLALHRPFIFCSSGSRDRAHHAALQILAGQNRLFGMSEPREYLPFNLVFATFDAMVLLATVYILFPTERREQLEESLRSIEWGIARLDTMKTGGNKMAACALDAVQTLYAKMQERHHLTASHNAVGAGGETTDGSEEAATYQSDNTSTPLDIPISFSFGDEPGPLRFEGFTTPSISDMVPPQPLHDLIFKTNEGTEDGDPSGQLPADLLPQDNDLWDFIHSFPET